MFNLNTPAEQARFLIVLGYSRELVLRHIRTTFPRVNAESVVTEAVAQHQESERQLDAAVRADDERARAAEHDLNRSMHE